MFSMKRILLIFAGLLIMLFGCQQNDTTDENADKNNDETTNEEVQEKPNQNEENNKADEENENQVDLSKYFKPDNTTAYFLGDGIEYSTYTEKTVYLSDEYIGTLVDNGGITMMFIYKISDDQIDIIYREPVEEVPPAEPTFPEKAELDSMESIEIYLKTPFEIGTTFDKWTIVETDITLETPYKTFEHVFVIEEKGEDYINKKYFVEGYGEIKTEFIMNIDQDEEYIVTSTLEKIENH